MSRKFSIFLSVLFCAFIGGILVISTILPDRKNSELENRSLQQVPELSLESLTSGRFMKEAEDYTEDQIVGRDLWVAMKAWCERLSGKKENSGFYFGAKGTLLQHVEDPDPDKLAKDMGYVDALVGNVSVPVYFGLIPSSSCVWAERLPKGAPTADEASIISDVYFSTGANTIDVIGALSAHKDEDIYYRTDHHWTSLGAFYGANAVFEAMGLDPIRLEDYTKTTVSTEFNGTSFSTSGVRWLKPDSIDTYIPEDGVHVTSWFSAEPVEGRLYVDSYLSVKDKYSYFLGGRQPLCVIQSEKNNGPRVMLIRDSYSDSLAPFLTERFSEIHLYDARNNMNSVKDYVAENGIDAVIVLYSFPNFMSDHNLFLLSR